MSENSLNDTKTEYPASKTLHGLFEEMAALVPDNNALVFEDRVMKYCELNERANQLAWLLIEKGINANENVGLIMNKGIDMIVALLAILKTGAAYVPVDPAYPKERKDYIIKNSDITAVLMQEKQYVNCKERIVVPEYDLSRYPKQNPQIGKSSSELAYIIYTSGSTGLPKGVMVTHYSVVNLIYWVNKRFGVNENDTLLFVTSICFDLSVYDVFGILAAGGRIVIAGKEQVEDPRKLIKLFEREKITFWDSVPTTINFLVNTIKEKEPNFVNNDLRLVFLSGDWIPVKLPCAIKDFFPNANVISLGGATECSVWSIYYPIEKVMENWKSIPYGKPIANTDFYILDEAKNPVPEGEIGELYIGGVGVANGYINDRERTEAAFFADNFAGSGMMYKTGDLGKMMDDGNIEFLGRKDYQVKIRGFRVETGEIEKNIEKFRDVEAAVVTDRSDAGGNKYICAYIVSKSKLDLKGLKGYLSQMLPEYMIPSVFVQVDKFPLNENGKVNRKALPEPSISIICSETDYVVPSDSLEMELAELWGSILGIYNIGVHNDFFEIGGSSILAVKLEAEYERRGIPLTLQDINKVRTIRGQLLYLSKKRVGADENNFYQITGDNAGNISNHSTGVCCTGAKPYNKVVIENIKPFNDVFYKSCFYNSLFPVLAHFSQDIKSFLVNDIGVYLNNKHSNGINIDVAYISEKPDFEVLNDIGISVDTKMQENNLVSSLLNAIGNGNPVILFIDSFYEPFRVDNYRRYHFPHTILVSGYDEEIQAFNIVEHNHRDSLSYKMRNISYEDIVKAHKGYMENFVDNDKADVYMEFFVNQTHCVHSFNYKEILKKYMRKHHEVIYEGIESLPAFSKEYLLFAESGIKDNFSSLSELIKVLNKIIDNRRVERYKIFKIIGSDSPVCKELSDSIDTWNEIRRDLIKLLTDRKYRKEVFTGHVEKVLQIYDLEMKYQNELSRLLNHFER